jgi:hypothetical protein
MLRAQFVAPQQIEFLQHLPWRLRYAKFQRRKLRP